MTSAPGQERVAPEHTEPGSPLADSAEPRWLTEVRLRAGRRALWLRWLWAGSRYPGEDAMAIGHSEVDRATGRPGNSPWRKAASIARTRSPRPSARLSTSCLAPGLTPAGIT